MSSNNNLRARKQKNYGAIDTHVEIKEAESEQNPSTAPRHGPRKKRLNEVKDCSQFCEYLSTDTCSKLSFIYFFVSIFVPFIIAFYYFALDEYRDAYIVSGIFGFATCVYASNHFRTLFALKNEIDNYSTYNDVLQSERKKFNQEISVLKKGRMKLGQTHNQLQMNNLKLCDMIQKFEAIEQQLNSINATNYEELSQVGDKAKHLKGKYYDISIQQQRNILFKIFDRLQLRSEHKKGLTRDDYDLFYSLLPTEHKERFERLGGFDALLKMSESQDKGYVDSDDFAQALDVYATMQVENCDITFKIDRVPSGAATEEAGDGQTQGQRVPKYMKKVTILTKKKRKGFYLTKEDIWNAVQRGESHKSKSRSPSPSPLAHEPVLGRQHRINE
mmetsp:Transcript_45692/g.73132  ORF Transcript_45692/g.73132 Transcript_45692/m.73132 type:complete len:388 (+) Transcript_45692:32-1195(+)